MKNRWEKLVNRKWEEFKNQPEFKNFSPNLSYKEKEKILRTKGILSESDKAYVPVIKSKLKPFNDDIQIDEVVKTVTERIKKFMPDVSSVEVKKDGRIGGLPNGKSKIYNQGDINALVIKKMNEAEDYDRYQKQSKDIKNRKSLLLLKNHSKLNDIFKKYFALVALEKDIDNVISHNKMKLDGERDYELFELVRDSYLEMQERLKEKYPDAYAEYSNAVRQNFKEWSKIQKYFQKLDTNIIMADKKADHFGLKGDLNSKFIYHNTTTDGAYGIISENVIYAVGDEIGGVAFTTHKNLVKQRYPIFYHSSEYSDGTNFKNLSTQLVFNFDLIKADNIKYKVGSEHLGTHVGEEEIRLFPKTYDLENIKKYLVKVIIDPTKEKDQNKIAKLIDLLKSENIPYFIK